MILSIPVKSPRDTSLNEKLVSDDPVAVAPEISVSVLSTATAKSFISEVPSTQEDWVVLFKVTVKAESVDSESYSAVNGLFPLLLLPPSFVQLTLRVVAVSSISASIVM